MARARWIATSNFSVLDSPKNARGNEAFTVDLYIEINANRIPTLIEILDKPRFDADPVFHDVAVSAIDALRNPRCNPLMLPPEKYSEWQKIRMTFNPKDMM